MSGTPRVHNRLLPSQIMKFMKQSRQNSLRLTTSHKKKKNSPTQATANKIHTSSNNSHRQFSKIFQSTTFLNRSPSHSFQPPLMQQKMNQFNANFQRSNNIISAGAVLFNSNQRQVPKNHRQANHDMPIANNQQFRNFQNTKKQKYKKSKNIKISSNSNKGYFMKGFHHPTHYQQQQQLHYNNQFNSDQAANNLANMLQSELTINLTKHEPRKVLYNNHTTTYSQHNMINMPNNNNNDNNNINNNLTTNNRFQKLKNSYQPGQTTQLASQCPSSGVMNQQRYVNRFKYVKPANVRTHAPYNTTQYIMYDYSRRRPTDQECPNEQQQFSDDWDMALVNGTSNATESLNKLANDINNPLVNANGLISLSENANIEVVSTSSSSSNQVVCFSGSLGSSLGSNMSADLVMKLDNITAAMENNPQQLSSSL